MFRDYVSKPKLDTYDESQFDDTEYPRMQAEQRYAAEREMDRQAAQRERLRMQRGVGGRRTGTGMYYGHRLPAAIESEDSGPLSLGDSGLLSGSSLGNLGTEGARSGMIGSQIPSSEIAGKEEEEEVEGGELGLGQGEQVEERFNLGDLQNLNEAFTNPAAKRELAREFRDFLHHFVLPEEYESYQAEVDKNPDNPPPEPQPYYKRIMQDCKRDNKQSIVVSYKHISLFNSNLITFLSLSPKNIFPLFDEVASQLMNTHDEFYQRVAPRINVRYSEVTPETPLTKLRFEERGEERDLVI